MPTDYRDTIPIRIPVREDRAAIQAIVEGVGNFSPAEVKVALELVDTYLNDPTQEDYRFAVAEDPEGRVRAFACWGPTPMTCGTWDLYWIATHPQAQRLGLGRALVEHVQEDIRGEAGRLLVVETSSKESYGATLRFYREMAFEQESRIRDFYRHGDDKLIFVKNLSADP